MRPLALIRLPDNCTRTDSIRLASCARQVKIADQEDYKRMRNGTADYFRRAGYRLNAQVTEDGDEGLRVYLVLHRRDEQ